VGKTGLNVSQSNVQSNVASTAISCWPAQMGYALQFCFLVR